MNDKYSLTCGPTCESQVTLDAIGISMRALVHVMNLFLIAFVIFVLAGVSLYQTSFQRRCVLPQGGQLVFVHAAETYYVTVTEA